MNKNLCLITEVRESILKRKELQNYSKIREHKIIKFFEEDTMNSIGKVLVIGIDPNGWVKFSYDYVLYPSPAITNENIESLKDEDILLLCDKYSVLKDNILDFKNKI